MPITSARSGADERAALLPADLLSLFDDAFVRSCDLIEAYVAQLAFGVVRRTGLDRACAGGASVEEALARAGLAPGVARVPTGWLLETMVAQGWATRTERPGAAPRYEIAAAGAVPDAEAVARSQAEHDRRCLPAYRLAAAAAACYPAVLRGETTGEAALFNADTIGLWGDYFSNANPLYAVANELGARAACRALAVRPGAVLEVGGGLGSAAEALLARGLAARYRFTELSPLFLRRAKRLLAARFPGRDISFAPLDIDAPFAAAGAAAGDYALVYGVNVLHVARDLRRTLREMREALAPGGAVVIAECVRPWPGRPVYVEFVFNLLRAFRAPVLDPDWRPGGGFLTPEQWEAAFRANGFEAVRVEPDIARLREAYPSFVAAAITARRA
jgi:SAM-dependent methyltransferase